MLFSTPISAQTQPETTTTKENKEELFKKVFGRPQTSGVQPVIVPFFIDGQQNGQTTVVLSPGGIPAVRLQATPVLEEIAKFVRPETQKQLTTAVDTEGNLSLEVLQQNGLIAAFNERTLELQIQIPPAQRKTNIYQSRQQGIPPEAENALRPSTVSGYVNLRGGEEFIWSGNQAATLGRQPLRLDIEGAVNVKGWVLEGSSNFTEGAQAPLIRGDLRLVKDDPANSLRYVFGDVSTPVTGYQRSIPMAGITVAKNFSLQPYRITRPISEFEFFLETQSKVEVFVNNRLVDTLQLPAGKQDIRDLPLAVGANDVQLVITDNVGRVSRLNFSTALANELLAPGLQQFASGLGFPARVENGVYTYDWQRPTLSLSHRWGLSNNLTMGGYLQGDTKQQMAGIEGIIATSLGNLGWDIALSNASNLGADYAVKLRYNYFKFGNNNPSQRTFNIAIEHQGSNFMSWGDEANKNKYNWDISANYGQKIFNNINTNLSARYQFGNGNTPDKRTINLSLSKNFRNGLGINFNISQSLNSTGQDEQRVYVSFSWLRTQQQQSTRTNTEIANSGIDNQMSWNYNSREAIGGIISSINASKKSNTYQGNGQLSYTNYRGKIDIFHALSTLDDGSSSNKTKLTFGTALVFADGYFGWSRPVENSFALVVAHHNLERQTIGINPAINGYTARIDRLGPAIIPNLQPYNVSNIKIDSSNLPLGYDLGQEYYAVLPSYKSGTLIRVGTDATVFLRGKLLLVNGKAVALQSGKVISLSDHNWQTLTLFTNKAGKFALPGLKPGRYEIRLLGDLQQVVQFEIPANQAGLYNIGTLTMSTQTASK
ncbi:MAG: fimbria/pilus outer membrane usher protein [Nostoc sp. ChiSLP02]|nr:fimbria/pilus outer membrane usher protein [Nostoc sp. DedSLP05]MDZ8100538.1 fimbria/pilus outer membrane usher protein [Nostoc sp. DedSLP01]MDZ8186431.1 fimbria/pilus outer membrane usher protein [Nostoc sp. ChiSLP02]